MVLQGSLKNEIEGFDVYFYNFYSKCTLACPLFPDFKIRLPIVLGWFLIRKKISFYVLKLFENAENPCPKLKNDFSEAKPYFRRKKISKSERIKKTLFR